MANSDEIGRNIHRQCPHCGMTVPVHDVVRELISKILTYLIQGEKVSLMGIGMLYLTKLKARTLRGLDGQPKDMQPKYVIRFRSSSKAKDAVNKERFSSDP